MPNKFKITVFILSNVNHIKEKTKEWCVLLISLHNIVSFILEEVIIWGHGETADKNLTKFRLNIIKSFKIQMSPLIVHYLQP